MAAIQGFHHIAINAVDFDSAIDLYTRILGFSKARSWGTAGKRCAMLDAGNNNIVELFEKKSPGMENGSLVHYAFRTDNCDEIIDRVRKEGLEITVEPKDIEIQSDPVYPARIAFFKGAAGEVIELFQER